MNPVPKLINWREIERERVREKERERERKREGGGREKEREIKRKKRARERDYYCHGFHTVPLTCSRPVLYGDSNGEAVCRGLKEEVEVLCEGVEVEEEARDCSRDRLIGRKERT